MMGARRRLLAAVAAAALAVACGGAGDAETTQLDDSPTAPSTPEQSDSTDATTSEPGTESETALVARTDSEIAVHTAPDGDISHVVPATTGFGSPRALLVLDDQGDWLEVALPERPNGSTGWVEAEAVEQREVPTSIDIDLAARTLTLYENGEVLVVTTIAIGTADNPTPTGDFYVTDKLLSDDPGGAYGPFAFGLSAYSETLSEFGGGDGQVGIHGTNDPASIGQAASHGCLRVPNDVAELLNDRLHLGTPVTIS